MSDMDIKLEIFSDMMLKVWKVFYWHYDSEDRLISSTCPETLVFDNLFAIGGCKRRILDACTTNKKAAIVADSTGLAWIAVPYFVDDVFSKLFVIGPVFVSEVSENSMELSVQEATIPVEWRVRLLEYLRELPVIQHSSFTQFGVMLQHHINGDVIHSSDIQIVNAGDWRASLAVDGQSQGSEVVGSYYYERKLMKAIETGNIDFKRPSHPPKVGRLSRGDPLRQAKNEMLVFITITSRAALRGGLPEETAYGLVDQYILKIEGEKDISQVYASGTECYNDYLDRMYKLRLSQGRTREIQNCIAYIEAHLYEKIDYKDMALKCGFSRNYLSVKFKNEMGISMVDYITKQRIEQAKIRLRNSNESILDISETLKFSSNSYFGSVFHKIVGVTPGEYRNGMDGHASN